MSKWYNSSWSNYKVESPSKFPTGVHYQVLVFDTKKEYQNDPYSRDNSSYSVDVKTTECYVFLLKEELEKVVSEIIKTDTQFVFYKVEALGQAKISVEVDIKLNS